jgi:molecular chaperone DnaJ
MSRQPSSPHFPYIILGVSRNATSAEIRTAYRRLFMAHHPDRLMNATEAARRDGEEKMKQINAAYAILNDPARRTQYDFTHPQQLSVRPKQ